MSQTRIQLYLRHPLVPLLLLSAVLFFVAIDWGLPGEWTWAADELVPVLVLQGLEKGFAEGWHTQYPLFHFYLLSAVYAPFRLFGASPDYTLALAGRVVSALMGLGSLVALYLLGRAFLSVGWTLVAVALFAFTPQVVYYSKLANLEIPYTFWLLWSFYFLWKIFEQHRGRDYLIFTFCAITAICTKEQVFGFYVLLVPLVLIARYRSVAVRRVLLDRWVGYSLLLAVVCFVLFENLITNYSGFVAHIKLITGSKFQGYRMFRTDLAGHWGMLKLTLLELAFVLNIPALCLSVLGIAIALRNRHRNLWLILAVISYQIFFIHVVLYAFDRFFIPVAAVLLLFTAFAMQAAEGRARFVTWFAATLLVLYQFGRAVEVDLMMVYDNRYQAEAWLQKIPKDRVIGEFGQRRYLPRTPEFAAHRAVSPFRSKYRRIQPAPDCLVMSYLAPQYWPRMHPARDFLPEAEKGTMGLKNVYTLPEGKLGTLFFNPRTFLGQPQISYSNLAKISPEVRIYSNATRCQPGIPTS